MKSVFSYFVSILLLLVGATHASGAITGPATLCAGETSTYSFIFPVNTIEHEWLVSGGTIVGSNTGTSIQVQWNTTVGSGVVYATYGVYNSSYGEYVYTEQTLEVTKQGSVGGSVSSVSVCSGGSGTLKLTGYSGGSIVKWQKSTNSGSTWTDVSSTSTTLTFSAITQTTLYRAVIDGGDCSDAYSSSGTVTIKSLPTQYTLLGTGLYCEGTSGATIGTSSETNVTYETLKDGVATGNLIEGTGASIQFTQITQQGTYTVKGTGINGCSSLMNKSIAVVMNAAPGKASGSTGSRCGSGTVTLTATPGTNGDNIKWYSVSSGGSALSTGTSYTTKSLSATTTYYAASYNSSTGCEASSRLAISAKILSVPEIFQIEGGGSYCSGGTGVDVSLSGSQDEFSYELLRNGAVVGVVPGGGAIQGEEYPIDFGNQTIAGTYTVAISQCGIQMDGTAVVSVDPLSVAGTISTTATQCGSGSHSFILSGYTGSISSWQYCYKDGSGSYGAWTTASGTSASISLSLTQATSVQRTYQIKTTVQSGTCSSASATTTVVVDPATVAGTIAGNSSRCGSGSETLTLSGYTGTILRWESRYLNEGGDWSAWTTFTETDNVVSITPSLTAYTSGSRTYEFMATVQSGTCSILYPTKAVVIYPYPTVSAGSNITAYESSPSFIITGGSPTGGSWSGSYVSSNAFNPQLSGNGTFVVTYVYTTGNGCSSSATKSVVVQNDPVPTASATAIRFGQPVVLSLTGFATVQWYKDGVLLSGATQSSYTASSPGVYFAKFVTTQGISGTSQSVNMEDGTLGDYNYIITHMLKTPVTDPEAVYGLDEDNQSVSIQYFDGLGRPMQTVNWRASPDHTDLVQPILYDAYGRNAVQYLPYAADGDDGSYKPNAIDPDSYTNSEQYAFYQNANNGVVTDPYPYATTIYEASPLNRVIEQGAPGASWQPGQHTVKTSWDTNAGDIPLFEVDASGAVVQNGYYEANTLWITITTDENAHAVSSYVDKQGQTVLKTVSSGSGDLSTYYVYDDFGDLRAVLPPEGYNQYQAGTLSLTESLDLYGFRYTYDGRHRLIEKTVPGASTVYLVYDAWDRLVLTQDGNQRATHQWTYTAYDAFDRPLITGFLTDATSRASLQTRLMSLSSRYLTYTGTGTHGYSSDAYPFTGIGAGTLGEVLTVTYYDAYDYLDMSDWSTSFDFTAVSAVNLTASDYLTSVKGQVTGSKTRILGTDTFMNAAIYYDDKYRVIQATTHNDDLSITRISTAYDFIGKPLTTRTDFEGGSFAESITETYTYDQADRLLTTTHQIGTNEAVTLQGNTYNEIGQLLEKNLHVSGDESLQSIDYQYNIRGWLTHINEGDLTDDGTDEYGSTDYFGMQLLYDDAGAQAQYNGNIGLIHWRNLTDAHSQFYAYTYDPLSRLKAADYYTDSLSTASTYDVSGITYDANGNIQKLLRMGMQDGTALQMDNLTYTYTGNQLQQVEDGTAGKDVGFINGVTQDTEYTYDANGNMVTDLNKGISGITYNHLNLPETVAMDTVTITYTYAADGTKLKKAVTTATETKVTRYQGGLVFEDGALELIQTAEGRVVHGEKDWEYQYHLKDHLGNVRMTVTSIPGVYTYLATMEAELADLEDQLFANMDASRQPEILGDHTHLVYGFGNEAARLNANDGTMVGPALSLYVKPGDTLDMAVYAIYSDTPNSGKGSLLIADAVTNAFGVSSGENTSAVYDALTDLLGGGSSFLGMNYDQDVPQAYLTYHYFDMNHNYITSGFSQVNDSLAGDWQELTLQLLADQPGYVYIYVANETQEDFDVFFDDLEVDHVYGPVVQQDDYYPFGLTFNSYTSGTKNNYLYNQGFGEKTFQGEEGKTFAVERQAELGVDFTKFRVYDPALGRFWNIDPAAEMFGQDSWTPYHYSFNNPIRWNDPFGNYPPGGIFRYMPSASVQKTLASAQQSYSKVFEGSVSVTGKLYGVGGKGQVGPVKLEGSASVASVSGKLSQNGVEIEGKALNAEAKASFASASAKASISGAEGKATINSEGVKLEGDALKASAKASVGKNGFELTADNSTKVGAGVQVSVVKVEGSINIGEAIKGTASLISAGLEYAADVISSGMDEVQESTSSWWNFD